MFKQFLKAQGGNFASFAALASLPLILAGGVALDYTRYLSAEKHLQDVADAAALAIAASDGEDESELRALAEKYVSGNHSESRIQDLLVASLDIGEDQVDLELKGRLKTSFMGIVRYDWLDVSASSLAVRAVTGSVELALVLDNTWSMSEKDSYGVTKITTLKKAAGALVTELMSNPKADVSIGLVPYADYVNVGTKYRNESWLSVPADYDVEPKPKVCEIKDVTSTPCLAYAPKYSCTTYVDGVAQASTCGGQCVKNGTPYTEKKEVCSGGGSVTKYRWYGCIGSRMSGTTRLNDGSPAVTYPGYVETSQKCLNPIVPLSKNKASLASAIDGMIINISSYKPYTYIPAGMIWGVNLLSPTAPFKEAGAYDAKNVAPRKAIVLMTDGENTLRFNSGNGRHASLSSTAATAATQLAQTNADTKAICDYAKTNKIEIFSVAFMVDNVDAKSILEYCATDTEHYFDASDPDKLMAAFSGIARSLSQVRLAR